MPQLYEMNHEDRFLFYECTRTTCRRIIERLYVPKSGTKIVLVPKWIPGTLHNPLLGLYRHYNVSGFPTTTTD